MSNQSKAPGVDAGFELVITDAASEQVGILAGKHSLDPDVAGLRVGAYEGGCSGYMYDVRMEQRPDDDDRVLEINGIRVFVNEFSMPLVSGMKVGEQGLPSVWSATRVGLFFPSTSAGPHPSSLRCLIDNSSGRLVSKSGRVRARLHSVSRGRLLSRQWCSIPRCLPLTTPKANREGALAS